MALNVGDVFGNLTVLSESIPEEIGHGHFMHKYKCKCSCGKILTVYQGEIIGGHIKGCFDCSPVRNQPLRYNLAGERFGRLTVESQAKTLWSDSGKSRMIRWNCVCDCGNKVAVNSRALRTGKTLSCGCYQRKRVSETLTDDLTGQRFGKLTVVEKVKSYRRPGNKNAGVCAVWRCRCDCGNEVTVMGQSLKCGDNVSCGCQARSQSEIYIEEILTEYGLIEDKDYFCEKTFNGLVSDYGGALRFDFAIKLIDTWLLIEYQGEQHYKSVKYFGGDESFEHRKKNDAKKREWALSHNYDLIEVPYTIHQKSDIENILLNNHVIELSD